MESKFICEFRDRSQVKIDRIFESRINLDIRFTCRYGGENIILRNIGAQDLTLKNP
jgi:hypothetical protein